MHTENKLRFQRQMLKPLCFRFFLILKLPLALLAGVKLKTLDDIHSITQLNYSYLNKNPFKSIYFAALSMAGELASGILAASFIYKNTPKVSMLVLAVNIEFFKKAVGLINFRCNQGREIQKCIQKSIITKQAQTIEVITTATDKDNNIIAVFLIKWSFKLKK